MTSKTRSRLFALFILAFPILVLFCFVISKSIAPLSPIQALPNPNGYDDFVKAGQMVASNTWNFDKLNQQELKALVTSNSNALQLARSGLQQKCRVILDYSASSPAHLEELSAIKLLACGFSAEGLSAQMENHPDDAAKSYLDIVHLANQSAYGGTLLDEMDSRTVEGLGTEYLQKLVGKLAAKSCRETATTLESLDSQRQTWDEVMQQEQDWSRQTYTGVRYEIQRLMNGKSLGEIVQRAGQHFKEQQIKTRQLIIALATRAYELDKGKPPANLSDLVPDYLKAVPQDPFTGTDVVYSPR